MVCAAFALLSPVAPNAQAPAPDPKVEAARAAFEALPETERRGLQEALVWTGDYNSTTTGGFGRRTFDGLVAFQRRSRLDETGILDAPARRELKSQGDKARAAAGFEPVLDPPSGIRIGLPRKYLPKIAPNATGGTRYQSADGRATLDTRTAPGGEPELKELYERNLAIQTPGRKITYKILRPDFFVVTGETAGGRFFTRYASGPGGLRGFSIGYDKALAKDYEPIVVAIANSFEPFPSGDPPRAAAPAPSANLQGPTPTPTPPEPTGGASTFTGLQVGPRLILTSAAASECRELQADGGKVRVAKADRERGIALVETDRERRRPPLALSAPGGASGGWSVLFVARDEGARAVAAPAELREDGRLVAALQPGAAGAVAFDRAGRIAGIVTAFAEPPRRVAGLVPPAAYPFAPASAFAALGLDLPVAPEGATTSRTVGAVAAEIGPVLVALSCAPGARRP